MEESDEPLKVGDYAIVIPTPQPARMVSEVHKDHPFEIGSEVKVILTNDYLFQSYKCTDGITEHWLSYRQLKREDFIDIVKQILSEHGDKQE